MTYITGFLIPVKTADKDRYLESARKSWPLFQKYGCLEQVETWGEDIPEGETTSFPRAVKREPGEAVVFSWLRWPDRATADKCFAEMMNDPDFDGMDMPFDGKRMMWAGFDPIFEGK
ncbi:MAG: DUF1428 domain-containing protein [Brevundimonas sp.]|uniref:DUF1428 domain-containing protein n=1 Tax=Brevundimonas sp. TaxID=1871086 RepID=UPI0026158957|nr:DUF1428 domain-containing protein [Brevundimonas sp.]MDI6625217.1 DUF1428 domain-containing protein [Brevundimonas sp.]MDQ7813686.1 DUF1428 domain-containing protein [Brevundimonas sp.]